MKDIFCHMPAKMSVKVRLTYNNSRRIDQGCTKLHRFGMNAILFQKRQEKGRHAPVLNAKHAP